jgi:hypothetical protein
VKGLALSNPERGVLDPAGLEATAHEPADQEQARGEHQVELR